ncbi:MAG: EamA family transporter [Gammaproteobacteria bacterium]|nr:MAG: EamA family transporter [Gammaproteobacteria bacterium]
MRSNNIILGCLFAMIAELCFVGMGSLVKLLSENLPSQNVLFFRNLFGLLVLSPLIFKLGVKTLKTKKLKWHFLRSLSGVSAMYCFFYALSELPLADAMLLKISAPLFIPIIAFVWLSEYISLRAIMAILIGFLGVVLVLKPTGAIHIASLAGLMGGALAALAKVTIRRMSDTEPTSRIVFYFGVISLVIATIPMFWFWQNPNSKEWGLLILLGAFGTFGQLFLTKAYTLAPASRIAPFTYSSILFAGIIGWVFWDEIITVLTVSGALLIILAGILIIQEKRQSISAIED